MILSTLSILLLQIFATRSELINDPTLKPACPFSLDQDVEAIGQEMEKGFRDVDREKISKIIFHRTFDQRAKIEESYNHKFCDQQTKKRCSFHSALKDISTRALEALYNNAFIPPEGILAIYIHDSIAQGDCEVGAIEESVCANDQAMKDRISKIYQEYYQTTVENDLKTFRKEDEAYQKVILNYCWKGLKQDKKITADEANNKAQELRKIDYKMDKEGFKKKLTELLDSYSEPDLKQIFQKYRQEGCGIDNAVEEAFEVERVRRAYKTLVCYVEDTCKFYADQLYDIVDHNFNFFIRAGKIDRIILTRCERDLLCIFNKYKDIHGGKTFTNHLKWRAGVSLPRMHTILVWKTLEKCSIKDSLEKLISEPYHTIELALS